LIYLALNAISSEWKRSVREWHAVKSQFAIMFENRFPMAYTSPTPKPELFHEL